MTAGYTPQQGLISGESQRLADADLNEGDRRTREDHFAHAAGKICQTCGRKIEAGQVARRRGETDWVHDACPVGTDQGVSLWPGEHDGGGEQDATVVGRAYL